MRFLPRLSVLALLAACGGDAKPPAALTIMMFTGDLDLPEDTDLVGLYIAQIEASGRTRRVLAYEATPLREPGMPARVPFPSDFVVVSRGEADKVHVRLVAYKKQTHEVLTMRETRTSVPDDAQRGLRMNLFFTNQNNVQDATPGAPVLSAAEGLSTLDESGEISSQAFERFTSICNGAPAPEGMTAGDDGSCVPLEVPIETLPLTNAPEFLAGTRKGDSCYDVHHAFADDGAAAPKADVFRVATSTLPVSGECRIPLPAVFDPARLNVAMVTSDPVFEKADGTYSRIRPLAANLAFRQVGSEVVLPPHVCDLARKSAVTELAFSQRALTWGGFEPVCSKWNTADTARPSDGSAPEPLPDAGTVDSGPDGSVPLSVSYDVTSAAGSLVGLAARIADLGLLTSVSSGRLQVALFAVPTVGAETEQTKAFVDVTNDTDDTLSLVAVSNGRQPLPSGTEFFLQGSSESGILWIHPLSFAQSPVVTDSMVSGTPTHVAELAGRRLGLWHDGNSSIRAASIDGSSPPSFVAPVEEIGFGIFGLASDLGPVGSDRFVLPAPGGGTSYLDCTSGAALGPCTKRELSNPTSLSYFYAASARAGSSFFGFYAESAQGPHRFDYGNGSDLGPGAAPVGKTASLDDSFCGVFGVDRKKVECFTASMFRSGTGTTMLDGAIRSAAVASDGQGLNVAYQCSGSDVVHVTRVFSGNLHVPGVVANRCAVDGGAP